MPVCGLTTYTHCVPYTYCVSLCVAYTYLCMNVQVCRALSKRARCPFVSTEFPLVAGADIDDVEEAKKGLLSTLKATLGLASKTDFAPVSCSTEG